MEVVLAIALTAVVVYLLTTAIELYLFSVDASRTRVESAQLARTILDQIADDLVATRLYAPQAGGQPGGGFGGGAPSGGQGNGGGPNSGGGAGENNSSGNSGGPPGGGGYSAGGGNSNSSGPPGAGMGPLMPTTVQGIYGNEQIIRLDRGASANWERASRQVDPLETTPMSHMPASVRYYFLDAQHLTTEAAARQGVPDERTAPTVSGLYRETLPTATISPQADPLLPTTQQQALATVELLAPEVVGFTMAYWDGKQLLQEWDSVRAGGLPLGVEIRITIAEPGFQSTPDPDEDQRRADGRYQPNELVEYSRFVYLPLVEQGRPAQPLLPGSQSGNQNGEGNQGGQNGNNSNGNNDQNNGGGGNNNGNAAQFQTN